MKSVLEKNSTFWSTKCVHCGHSRYDHDTHEKKCWSSSLQNNRCECPGFEAPKVFRKVKLSKSSQTNWENDDIQFPRLIAELEMAGAFSRKNIMADLCESMDLTEKDIMKLIERASNRWDKIKGSL